MQELSARGACVGIGGGVSPFQERAVLENGGSKVVLEKWRSQGNSRKGMFIGGYKKGVSREPSEPPWL